MNLAKLAFVLGLVGVSWSSRAWSAPPAAPPQPPKNIRAESSTAASRDYENRAANAEIAGDPQVALSLAERTIAADPADPWGHYDKAAALARLGRTDQAVQSFMAAEGRFAPSDLWARSVAIYGAAHAYAEMGRCVEARREFQRYSAFVRERDPKSADMADRYAAECRETVTAAPSAAPEGATPPSAVPPPQAQPSTVPPAQPQPSTVPPPQPQP